MRAAVALAALAALAGAARAADAPPAPPEASAAFAEAGPNLDGDVLDDPAWRAAPVLSGFLQATPEEGAPASERTEVRVLYTRDAVFFGVVCYDREPERIIVSESRRDAPLADSDSFQILLDTYLDRQNGFVFGTNPAGIEYDAQISNEGQGGDPGPGARQQAGAGGGFNLNWDGAWQVRARTGDFGWSAEFAIPFRTLRFARAGGQTWGVNFQRNIRRRKEQSFWAPLTRNFSIYRVSAAGTLRGIEIRPRKNLKVTPYLLGQRARVNAAQAPARYEGDLGGDAKLSLSSSLTLDATVNTDFAQVEVDELQVNLDRFNLFYPEKRPFFLENAGQFTAGAGGEVELFFSRRIGIGANGEAVPILAGGRLSGKLGNTQVGLLEMQTRATGGTAANNFAVARLKHDLPNRSGVGAIFVNRQGTGRLAGPDDWNRTYGVDGRLGFGRYGQFAGFLARTDTPGATLGQTAFQVGVTYDSPGWENSLKYSQVGEGFNPEVGFIRRRGYRKPELLVFRRFRPGNLPLGLLELRPHVSYRGFWKPDGFQESGFLHLDNHFEWKSSYEVHTGLNLTREGVRAPFEIFPGVVVPPGTYDHAEAQIVFMTNQGRPLSLSSTATIGGFFGGHRVALRPSARARVGESFNVELRYERNEVELAAAGFVAQLARARVSYSFTPSVYVQGLVQWSNSNDVWSTNLRFGWLQSGNAGFFLVYNETRDTRGGGAPLRDRSLVVKFSRLIDVLD